jgi:muramoyltetrapeptide carboxypeptidase
MSKIIDLIATGSKKDHVALKGSQLFIEKMGYKPRISPTIFGEHPLYVNQDEIRLQNLVDALYAEDSDIIWCLRGGSGTTRLLPHLFKLDKPRKPKMLIGLSDVTALLLFLSQHWGWQVVHGPTAHYAGINYLTPDALDKIVGLIKGTLPELIYNGLIPLNASARVEQVIETNITGGNLSLLEYSIGTPWQVQSQDCILFLEDINEPPYRIAERLEHLKQAGIFQDVKAILFGDFSHKEPDKHKPELIDFVLSDFSQKMPMPCFKNLPVGHVQYCCPLLMNAPVTLTTGPVGSLYQEVISSDFLKLSRAL